MSYSKFKNILKMLLETLSYNPKKLFLIDSFGAFISAILLFLSLSYLEIEFGIPKKIFYILFVIACFLSIFSFVCFININKNYSKYLQIISIANFLYCILTLILLSYSHNSITILGLTYFIIEMIIISCLAFLEYKTAKTK